MLPRTLDLAALFPPASLSQWRTLVDADLAGAPFERKLVTHTYEGLYVQPLYTRADVPPLADPSGFSGFMPMTRASTALGNARPGGAAAPSLQPRTGWDLRQEYSQPDPAAANAAIRDDLEGGVSSVLIRFDACARAGLDPRTPAGVALAARDGIAIHDVSALDRTLDGVHLEMIRVVLEAGAEFLPASACLAALLEHRRIAPTACRIAFNADPLAVLARDGHLSSTLEASLAQLASLAAWTSRRYPNATAVRVGTACYHHAGATATQDLAFSMATAVEYLRAMTRAEVSINDAARQIVFSYAVGCNIFLAIAKLRAARRLWARVAEACGADLDSRRMVMHARPSKRVLTTRDPWVNILRNTSCVFAAGIAGADAITSTPFDATVTQPTELSRRLARNTSHLLMDECSLDRVCDPAGGSYYIEHLTDELCDKAWVIFQTIEAQGGMAAALHSGWVRGQIDSALQPRLKNIATRKDAVVGVSEFPDPRPHQAAAAPEVDRAAIIRDACARLAPSTLPKSPPSTTRRSLVESAFALASSGASIADIHASLWQGDDLPAALPAAIHVHPYAEPFERMREASDLYAEQCGHRPSVFFAALGPLAKRLPRVNFCKDLFESGGFRVLGADGDGKPDSIPAAFRESQAHIAVICGTDDAYAAHVATLAPALHAAGARRVVLAGNPGANEPAYRDAGVDRFVYVKCDVVSFLSDLLAEEGVLA